MDPSQSYQQTEWTPVNGPGLPEGAYCRYLVNSNGQAVDRELAVLVDNQLYPFQQQDPRTPQVPNQAIGSAQQGQQQLQQVAYSQQNDTSNYNTASNSNDQRSRGQLSDDNDETNTSQFPLNDENGNRLDFTGTTGEREELDEDYQKRPDGKKFFVQGRCFKMLIADSSGRPQAVPTEEEARAGTVDAPTAARIRRFNQDFYVKALRLIVVKQERGPGRGYSKCVPIGTYGGLGAAKSRLNVSDHAVAYTEGTQPYISEFEPPMVKQPIQIGCAYGQKSLHPMSRIDFGRTHTVNWNVKVKDVGMVSAISKPLLNAYWADSSEQGGNRNQYHFQDHSSNQHSGQSQDLDASRVQNQNHASSRNKNRKKGSRRS